MSVQVEHLPDGIAVLTFSDPPLNLYSLQMHADFDRALDEVAGDQARALLIRAEGKVVSAGVDVAQFQAQKTKTSTKVLYDRMLELPNRIEALNVPTFFSAHGLTLTWAFEIAVACDLIVASDQAKFGLVERVIGLTPTMGGTQRLAARAGVGRAKEFVFTGDLYDAATLERWNVVNRVLPIDPSTSSGRADFDEAVLAFVQHIAIGPTQAFGAAKQILRHFEAGGVPQANVHTTEIAADLFDTDDLQHGMESFLTDGPGKATFIGR